MQYIDTPTPSPASTLILVHGSWHDGSSWSAVQEQLDAVGVESNAPTLPGHRAGDDRLAVSHDDYVSCVIAELDAVGGRVVLVGHSFGGSVISRVAELRPEDCHGLIYYSAFVPRDGERVADSLPSQFIEFLDQAAADSADRTIELPDQALREAFGNTADESTLARIRALLVPEPHAPVFETLALPGFPGLRIPAVYITCRDDRAMPPGTFHPGQSSRLHEPGLIEIDGDHEALLTAPERLADALLEALDAIEAAHRARRERRPRLRDVPERATG
jgi:pimeloyl-ACP methyl ester carboxylesterase